jgi:RNase P subunit RPR2
MIYLKIYCKLCVTFLMTLSYEVVLRSTEYNTLYTSCTTCIFLPYIKRKKALDLWAGTFQKSLLGSF